MPIKPGTVKRFVYPDFGTPNGYPELTAHSGQLVKVLKLVDTRKDGAVENYYKVKASDKFTFHAWASELRRVNVQQTETKTKSL